MPFPPKTIDVFLAELLDASDGARTRIDERFIALAQAVKGELDARLGHADVAPDFRPLSAVKREHILRVLDGTSSVTAASRALGVPESSLYKKIKAYGWVRKETAA